MSTVCLSVSVSGKGLLITRVIDLLRAVILLRLFPTWLLFPCDSIRVD